MGPCKWVLKLKQNANVNSMKYKTRLRIHKNIDETDLTCTFAQVADFIFILLILAVAEEKQWDVHRMG